MNTTTIDYDKCSYCGNYHTYSPEMCRDMVLHPQPVIPIKNIKEIEAAMDEAEDRAMANVGVGAFAEGLIVEDNFKSSY